jgi:hypothetical protein
MEKVTGIARDVLHELFTYDNGTLKNKSPRGRAKVGCAIGTIDSHGYLVATVKGKVYKVHRLIYGMFTDMVPLVLDHINGNPTDNRIENLRPATIEQNGYNRKVNKNSSSQIKGVAFLRGKWMAQCQSTGKRKYLGVFASAEQAALALKEFRNDTQKEFARNE